METEESGNVAIFLPNERHLHILFFFSREYLSRFRVNVTHCLYLDEHLLLLSYGFYLLVFPFICMLFPSMTLAQLLTHLCIVTGFVESPIRFNEYNIRNVFASTVVFFKAILCFWVFPAENHLQHCAKL